jgi:DNA-binding PadR family transcriptional regulator
MAEQVRITAGVARLLAVLVVDATQWRYGLDLMRATGQPSGSLYPMLTRLEAAGWLDAEWEDVDPVAQGRPARRYYRLTADGLTLARNELAELSAQLNLGRHPGLGPAGAAGTAPSTVVRDITVRGWA